MGEAAKSQPVGEPGPGGRRRDRRGRGRRGPDLSPGPLAPAGVPAALSRAERFDATALSVVEDLVERWPDALARLDVAVEDVPRIGRDWRGDHAPLGSLVPVPGAKGEEVRARLVLFRRPLEHRAGSREELAAVILMVACDELATLLSVPPEDVHPDYPG